MIGARGGGSSIRPRPLICEEQTSDASTIADSDHHAGEGRSWSSPCSDPVERLSILDILERQSHRPPRGEHERRGTFGNKFAALKISTPKDDPCRCTSSPPNAGVGWPLYSVGGGMNSDFHPVHSHAKAEHRDAQPGVIGRIACVRAGANERSGNIAQVLDHSVVARDTTYAVVERQRPVGGDRVHHKIPGWTRFNWRRLLGTSTEREKD